MEEGIQSFLNYQVFAWIQAEDKIDDRTNAMEPNSQNNIQEEKMFRIQ